MEKSKEEACGFDYPNGVNPARYNDIRYGTQHVPTPTNGKAKFTPHQEVMRATLEGK